MTATTAPAFCTADGCATDTTVTAAVSVAPEGKLQLDIVSDTICPWCFVAKRRIDRAIGTLAPEGIDVTTRWLPFELNPQMPSDGMNRKAYRSTKFGSWDYSQLLDAQVAREGAREGIVFRHDLIDRTPNTRASHLLIWLAWEIGGSKTQNAVVEKLFSAYFCEGRDIGDRQILTDIGLACGLPLERIVALFDKGEGASAIAENETEARSRGVRGVPLVAVGDSILFSGAQQTSLIVETLRKVAKGEAAKDAGDGSAPE